MPSTPEFRSPRDQQWMVRAIYFSSSWARVPEKSVAAPGLSKDGRGVSLSPVSKATTDRLSDALFLGPHALSASVAMKKIPSVCTWNRGEPSTLPTTRTSRVRMPVIAATGMVTTVAGSEYLPNGRRTTP